MSVVLDPAGDGVPASTWTARCPRSRFPLGRASELADSSPGTRTLRPTIRPLALRKLRPAPDREIPEHVYDPAAQVATDRQVRYRRI